MALQRRACGKAHGILLVAGCSLQDELFASFEQLLALADEKGTTYDRSEPSSSAVPAPLSLLTAACIMLNTRLMSLTC